MNHYVTVPYLSNIIFDSPIAIFLGVLGMFVSKSCPKAKLFSSITPVVKSKKKNKNKKPQKLKT